MTHLRGHDGVVTIGAGRMRVRRQILQWLDEDSSRDPARKQHRTLTQQQFRELCDTAGDIHSPESLLDYLHNAGIVFYQQGLFRDEIVLDQSWALEAIYTVFHRENCYRQLQQLGGRFTRSLLEALVWREYPAAEQELFLSMMESCGICFRHRKGDKDRGIEAEYIAPDLLPERDAVEHQLAGRWAPDSDRLERTWDYPFLHPGLVRSVISRVGREAGRFAVYWKCGVWFYEATTGAQAVIDQSMEDDRRGRIVLQTSGDRGELLERISEWIEKCHSLAGDPQREVSGTEPISERRPRGRLASGSLAAVDVPSDEEGAREPPALRFATPPRRNLRPQAYVSYSWREEASADPARATKVEEFCDRLKAAGREIIRDQTHMNPGDGITAFMDQLGSADRIYVFLSDSYLKSPNCMYELLQIWKTSGEDSSRFRDRIRAFTISGTDLYSIKGRLAYAAHWKKERDSVRAVIEEHGVDVLGPTDLRNWKRMQDFAHNVSEILAHVTDVLQPRDFDEYIDHAIRELSGDDVDASSTNGEPTGADPSGTDVASGSDDPATT